MGNNVSCVIPVMSIGGGSWVGCTVTCSTVSGEQISSPLRIMERWVNTSDSWKESRPSNSLTLLTTETHTDRLVVECVCATESGNLAMNLILILKPNAEHRVFRWLLLVLNNSYDIKTVILYSL